MSFKNDHSQFLFQPWKGQQYKLALCALLIERIVWYATRFLLFDHSLKSNEPGKAALESALWFSDKAHGGSEARGLHLLSVCPWTNL